MPVKTYNFNDNTQLITHFYISEFKCKCGGNHDTKLDTTLADKLEKLHKNLNCSKIIINSGYRCSSHDRNASGSSSGQHVNGYATDIVCYHQKGNRISSQKVGCATQDIDFGSITNIDFTYTAIHVDTHTANFWKGDEVKTTSYSVTDDFYKYYGLSKSNVYPVLLKNQKNLLLLLTV